MFFKCNIYVKARDIKMFYISIEWPYRTNLPMARYRLTNMIYCIKVQNAFTYSLITGNISNSLKKEKLSKT